MKETIENVTLRGIAVVLALIGMVSNDDRILFTALGFAASSLVVYGLQWFRSSGLLERMLH